MGSETTSRRELRAVMMPMYISASMTPLTLFKVALQAICTAPLEAFITNPVVPSAKMLFKMRASGLKLLLRSFKEVFLPQRKSSTHTQETACEMTVAIAAPATPMSNTKMKRGSSAMLTTAPAATITMPYLVYPCTLMKPFMPVESMTRGVPMR